LSLLSPIIGEAEAQVPRKTAGNHKPEDLHGPEALQDGEQFGN
jgi:ABC-type taurine transport system substrate-binding protein